MNDFGRLVEAEIPRLRRYARALRRNEHDADDLVQDTLARAFEKAHLWQPGTNLRAWLFTVLHNQYVNGIRRLVREGQKVALDNLPLGRPAGQPGVLELRDLRRAIDLLSEEQRAVVLLVGIEGMSYEEVAVILGIPVGTVRSRLSRGRDCLRQTMLGTTPDESIDGGATSTVVALRQPVGFGAGGDRVAGRKVRIAGKRG